MYLLAYLSFTNEVKMPTPNKLTEEEVRAKYLKMAKAIGYDEAVTALHNEIGSLEPRVFDGGYDKARFDRVQYMRALARELYTLKLNEESAHYYQKS